MSFGYRTALTQDTMTLWAKQDQEVWDLGFLSLFKM